MKRGHTLSNKVEIRESQIEDILSTYLDLTKNILSIEGELSLIGRQKHLPSGGILDMLLLGNNQLHLLELKVEESRKSFCDQIIGYKSDLEILQNQKELPGIPVNLYLVCPYFSEKDIRYCLSNSIKPITYSPYDLLRSYYFRVKSIANFIELKPKNHGVWNLYLLNRILYSIKDKISKKELQTVLNISSSTIGSYLKLSEELGLIITLKDGSITLTNVGDAYTNSRESDKPVNYISDEQSQVLGEFIKKNPFFSPATFGIYTCVETVFALSKNFYPVPFEECRKFFLYLSGKYNQWAEKASADAFKMYSNYAKDLGLLAKIDRSYYITPSGIRFILLLELNKSIMFVNSLKRIFPCKNG